ncbi:DUF6962 family protein [Arcticibacterium luteifluviistationis]|uniref:Uncharacterized protein n=1 Tax=Arcticibacterium luteifluviistationis TaxID=1784714 RepID=A0A2Z4GFK2_9BACT|nr:hypothetical protein [Arcticibacterium luteifluviistationis]AWV99563.1 hypothetical protein DJ013_15860 [Arcticibacterium luteifluviistationis]
METSHIISDIILGLVGVFVFFKYLLKLDLFETLLWEAFILSVSVAAFAGAAKFAGIEKAGLVSVFFQNISVTVGALGLVVAAWFKIWEDDTLDGKIGSIVLAIGFIIFALHQTVGIPLVVSIIPIIAMILVAAAGVAALLKGRNTLGMWLLLGVVFASLATFKDRFVSNTENAIDVYHYLLACSVLCFGLAASRRTD